MGNVHKNGQIFKAFIDKQFINISYFKTISGHKTFFLWPPQPGNVKTIPL